MSKYRVYELAKEFSTSSKLILDILDRNNMPAKNHMASIDEDAYQVLVRTFAPKPDTAEEIRERQRKKAAASIPVSKIEPPKAPPAPPKVFYGGGVQPRYQNRPRTESEKLTQPSRPFEQRPNNPQTTFSKAAPTSVRPGIPNVSKPAALSQPINKPTSEAKIITDSNKVIAELSQEASKSAEGRALTPSAQEIKSAPAKPHYPFRPAPPFDPSQVIRKPVMSNPPNRQTENRPVNPAAPSSRPATMGQAKPSTDKSPRFTNTRPGPSTPGKSTIGRTNTPSVGSGTAVAGKGSLAGKPEKKALPFSTGKPGFGKKDNSDGSNRTGFGAKRPQQQHTPGATRQEPVRPTHIKVGDSLSVKDLSIKLGREVNEVIKKLMMLGVMATINQEIDFDTASLIAAEFGVTVEELPPEVDPTVIPEIEDDPATLVQRSPVVTVMGHVDHGKTSLLDAIRQTHVTTQEAGGITQHIGAYQVVQQGKKIVFLDTPGHEAFTSMRARGAQVTDIAVLVVAADDGVMPQTIEALNHAKAAKVPIIVAINKMDRPDANPDRIQQQLTEYGLVAEAWGGDTIMVPVSALKKTGISDLLEMILLVSEVQDLKANPNRPALGTIVEAELDKGKGPVATVLVQNGTLRVGDSIIAGTAFGKVRAMTNDRGEKVKKAGPSTPVEVIGLSDVPLAGDILAAVDEKTARSIAEKRLAKNKTDAIAQSQKITLEDLFQQIQAGEIKDLNLVVKADVQGSIEALRQSLENLKNKEVRVMIVHSGVGAINESDVMLASAANALIIGFNVRPDSNARKAADSEKVDIRTYRVIYDAINDVEAAMKGMLAPEFKEVTLGRVEVRQVFNIPKGVVAGSYVLEGKITSASQVRLLRNGVVVFEGKLDSLRRFKDDVKEVMAGYECGITLEKYRDIKEGDIVEAFVMEQIPR